MNMGGTDPARQAPARYLPLYMPATVNRQVLAIGFASVGGLVNGTMEIFLFEGSTVGVH